MKGYRKYFGKKILWFLITLVAAVILNFILPRLMPADPVSAITGKMASGMTDASAVQAIYKRYEAEFGTNKPLITQFFIFVKNLFHGELGTSFSQYPRKVSDIISSAIGWTVCLQLPAILVGWLLGNILGALAAYIRKGFDKVLLPVSLFLSNVPAFGMAVTLLVLFAVKLKVAPIAGGYAFDMIPNMSWRFIKSVIEHYQLPFWSIVLVSIGGQAIGMRSMSIYELNADYVKYARFLGIMDIDVSELDATDTDALLDLWFEHYDASVKPKGMTMARRNFFKRLDKSVRQIRSADTLKVMHPEEGELVERSSITKMDYVNVTDVANVKLLPLGTDNFGRDVLKELVSATGTSIVIGLIAGVVATLIGLTFGLLAGYVGGFVDDIMVMYAGQIVEKGTAKEMVFDPIHPYSHGLMGSILVPEEGTRGTTLTAIPGTPPNLKKPPQGCRFAERCRYATDECRYHAVAEKPFGEGRSYRCLLGVDKLREVYEHE